VLSLAAKDRMASLTRQIKSSGSSRSLQRRLPARREASGLVEQAKALRDRRIGSAEGKSLKARHIETCLGGLDDRNRGRVVSLAYVGADYPHSVQKAEHFEAPLRARAQLLSFIDWLNAGRRQ
jgi:hypothetical protein